MPTLDIIDCYNQEQEQEQVNSSTSGNIVVISLQEQIACPIYSKSFTNQTSTDCVSNIRQVFHELQLPNFNSLRMKPGPCHLPLDTHTFKHILEQAGRRLDLRAYAKFRCHGNKGQPTTFCTVPLNWPSRKPPDRPKHLRSICHTSRLIGDFVQILGSKFWALGGLIKNLRTTFCRVPHGELTAKKWLDSIEKQRRRIDLKERYRHTDRQAYKPVGD